MAFGMTAMWVSRHVFNTYESVKTTHANDDTIAMWVNRHVLDTYESVKTAHTNDDTIAMWVDRHVLDTYEFVKNTHAHDGTMSLRLAAQFSMHAVVVSHLLVGSSPMIIYSTV